MDYISFYLSSPICEMKIDIVINGEESRVAFTVFHLPSFQPRQLMDGNKGRKHKCLNKPPNIPQDYQDPSADSTVTDGHRQGKKA